MRLIGDFFQLNFVTLFQDCFRLVKCTFVISRNLWRHLCFPAGNYLFKVNYRNPRTMCKICSKLTIKKPERRQTPGWGRSGVFIFSFEHNFISWSSISIVNFEEVNTDWVSSTWWLSLVHVSILQHISKMRLLVGRVHFFTICEPCM